jgi:hypothetical protein
MLPAKRNDLFDDPDRTAGDLRAWSFRITGTNSNLAGG